MPHWKVAKHSGAGDVHRLRQQTMLWKGVVAARKIVLLEGTTASMNVNDSKLSLPPAAALFPLGR
jgi:hypothetical protein